MSIRKLRQKDGAVYFATFSCHEWVPLFYELQAFNLRRVSRSGLCGLEDETATLR